MRRIIFCTVACLALVGCQTKNQRNSDTEVDAINTKFFSTLGEDSGAALDQLFSTNTWLDQGETKTMKGKFDSLVSQLGHFKGHELIVSRGIGKDYLLYSFLVKYERQPLRFILVYYKAGEKWQMQNFQFDYDFEPELREAASAYRLPNNLPFDETK